MNGDPELEAMAVVLQVLQPLDPQMQGRVIRWVLEKLEIGDHLLIAASREAQGSLQQEQGVPVAASVSSAFRGHALAMAWTRQNGITDLELECAFHQTGEELSVIAGHLPGSSRRERVLNCYLLAGACSLLSTGEANFTDQKARELCEEFGCLDTTNHSKYLGEKGNDFVGSKSKGWSLTAPGKKRVALLIKEIASSSA